MNFYAKQTFSCAFLAFFIFCSFAKLVFADEQEKLTDGKALPDKISPKELGPSADIIVRLKQLGRREQGDKPMRARYKLPKNFKPTHKHPIWLHLGNTDGWKDTEYKWINRVVGGDNFVVINVDHKDGHDPMGMRAGMAAIRLLEEATLIDREYMVISGYRCLLYTSPSPRDA